MCLCIYALVILDWVSLPLCSWFKHLPPHPSCLQPFPGAVTSFVSSRCDGDAMTSKTDMVSALLRGDLLFWECLLYVKGFPYTFAFTFHNNSMT